MIDLSKLRYNKKSELLLILQELKCSQEEISKMNRIQMINKIKELSLSNMLEETTTETEDKSTIISAQPLQIQSNSELNDMNQQNPNWTKYILEQLRKDELIDGHPTTDGLRRLFKLLIGDILNSHIELLQVPIIQNENRATAKCTLQYRLYSDNSIRSISDVSDCYHGNTKSPYNKFPTGTAATMAEGRCLRKLLGIKVITNEEAQTPSEEFGDIIQQAANETNNISPMQIKTVSIFVKRLGINEDKLLNYFSKNANNKIKLSDYNNSEAQALLRVLNDMQRGPDNKGIMIPEELYDRKETENASTKTS